MRGEALRGEAARGDTATCGDAARGESMEGDVARGECASGVTEARGDGDVLPRGDCAYRDGLVLERGLRTTRMLVPGRTRCSERATQSPIRRLSNHGRTPCSGSRMHASKALPSPAWKKSVRAAMLTVTSILRPAERSHVPWPWHSLIGNSPPPSAIGTPCLSRVLASSGSCDRRRSACVMLLPSGTCSVRRPSKRLKPQFDRPSAEATPTRMPVPDPRRTVNTNLCSSFVMMVVPSTSLAIPSSRMLLLELAVILVGWTACCRMVAGSPARGISRSAVPDLSLTRRLGSIFMAMARAESFWSMAAMPPAGMVNERKWSDSSHVMGARPSGVSTALVPPSRMDPRRRCGLGV